MGVDQREPGWYRDPHDHRVHHRWDGQRWTTFTPREPPPSATHGGEATACAVGTATSMTTTPAEPVQDPAYEPIIQPGEDPGHPPDTEPDPEARPEPQPA